MSWVPQIAPRRLPFASAALSLILPSIAIAQNAQIQGIRVLPSTGAVEIEIQMSRPVTPQTLYVASPDRLVIDFPESTPGPQLRGLAVNRGDVKDVRVGLFESHPPTTRIVLDLNTSLAYQLFPSGKSVLVKLGGPAAPDAADSNPVAEAPIAPPKPKVTVAFQNGLLSVSADKATLAQVLYEIHMQTGADVGVPAGAEQEKVVAALGPAPPRDVLAALLNGSPYNFIIVGSSSNPNVLERVLLSQKGTTMVLDVPMAGSQPPNQNLPAYASAGRTANLRMPNGAAAATDTEEQLNSLPPDEEPQPGDPQQGEQPAAQQPN
jgi:hypothetical protein